MHKLIFFLFFSCLFSAQIQLGNEILDCEIADTQETRATGLMGRTSLGKNQGMLFVYDFPQQVCFWMKNTLIPLSIGFFDIDKTLIKILDMDPPTSDNLTRYCSFEKAQYALEVNQGWFKEHKIQIGDKFSFLVPQGQLK